MLKEANSLPSNSKESEKICGGHIMTIIGYQNYSTRPNEGVFIVRNSWGADNGDNGNNYIDYDYFKAFGLEAVVISDQPISN